MAILVSIFLMLAITLIPALRSTFNQQGQINDLRDSLARQRQTVAALQQQQRQWSDPAYVEQQARERLKFARVGETSYTVIDGQSAPDDGGPKIAAPEQVTGASSPWYSRMWQSMVIADTPVSTPAMSQPSPAVLAPHG
jgi:cell division protein FtsB